MLHGNLSRQSAVKPRGLMRELKDVKRLFIHAELLKFMTRKTFERGAATARPVTRLEALLSLSDVPDVGFSYYALTLYMLIIYS